MIKTLNKVVQISIKVIQKIVIPIALFFIYIFGFGVTLIFVLIFNRKILKAGHKGGDTFWIKDQEDNFDRDGYRRQS